MCSLSMVVLLILLTSCVTTQVQSLNPATYYRNDICFEYKTGKRIRTTVSNVTSAVVYKDDIMKFCGVGVLPYRDSYDIRVIGHDKLNFFSIKTCHEENTSENPDRGVFKKNGEVRINYQPTLEKNISCPMYVSAYSKKQKHAWGIIVFKNPRFTLNATIKCNGYTKISTGVSICQSRMDLIQEISFDEEVATARPVNGAADRELDCPVLSSNNSKTFRFQLPPRECIYQFIGLHSKKIHRFYTVGYEDVVVRE